MKKNLTVFALLFLLVCPWSMAQTIKYGKISYEALLREMPEYGLMQSRLGTLRAAYESELRYNEQTF